MKNRLLVGIIVILMGISMFASNIGIPFVSIGNIFGLLFGFAFSYWGISSLRKSNNIGSVIFGIIMLSIGFDAIIENLGFGIININFVKPLMVPVAFILVGLSMMKGVNFGSKKKSNSNSKSNIAMFQSIEKKKRGWTLESSSYSAIMGGVELDLLKAEIPLGETKLDLSAIMGGVTIKVPDDVNVEFDGNFIFGGIEALGEENGGIIGGLQTKQFANSGKRIIINCTCAFGGIEIISKKRKENIFSQDTNPKRGKINLEKD